VAESPPPTENAIDCGYGEQYPAVIHRPGHAFWIAAGESVLRLGERTHVNPPHRARLPENLLGERDGRHHLIVFAAARGKDSTDVQPSPGKRDLIPSLSLKAAPPAALPAKHRARNLSGHAPETLPPEMRRAHPGRDSSLPKDTLLRKVSAQQCEIFPV